MYRDSAKYEEQHTTFAVTTANFVHGVVVLMLGRSVPYL